MAIFNSAYCKKHCFQNKQITIIPDIVKVLNVSEHRKHIVKLLSTPSAIPFFTLLTLSLLSIKSMNISMIKATSYRMLSKRRGHYCFALSMHDINKALEEKKKEVDSKTVLDQEY